MRKFFFLLAFMFFLNEASAQVWVNLPLQNGTTATVNRVRKANGIVEIEVHNLVQNTSDFGVLPVAKLPVGYRPVNITNSIFIWGVDNYLNDPILFKIMLNGDVYIVPSNSNRINGSFNINYQFKTF